MGQEFCCTDPTNSTTVDHREIMGIERLKYARSKTPKLVEYPATRDDFQLLKVVGQGTFGRIYLVMHRYNHCYFAMKVINKE